MTEDHNNCRPLRILHTIQSVLYLLAFGKWKGCMQDQLKFHDWMLVMMMFAEKHTNCPIPSTECNKDPQGLLSSVITPQGEGLVTTTVVVSRSSFFIYSVRTVHVVMYAQIATVF
jgi:hypothetical protein